MLSKCSLLAVLALLTAGTAAVAHEQADPATATPTTAAPAAETPPTLQLEDTPPAGRVLNGHVFIPSATVSGALTTTSFATYLVMAHGKTTGSEQIGTSCTAAASTTPAWGSSPGSSTPFSNTSARLAIEELVYRESTGRRPW